jgi:hypothetical protein
MKEIYGTTYPIYRLILISPFLISIGIQLIILCIIASPLFIFCGFLYLKELIYHAIQNHKFKKKYDILTGSDAFMDRTFHFLTTIKPERLNNLAVLTSNEITRINFHNPVAQNVLCHSLSYLGQLNKLITIDKMGKSSKPNAFQYLMYIAYYADKDLEKKLINLWLT